MPKVDAAGRPLDHEASPAVERTRRRPWWLVVLLPVFGVLLLVLIHGLRRSSSPQKTYEVRVVGSVVDARSGERIAGALLMVLPDETVAQDETRIAERIESVRRYRSSLRVATKGLVDPGFPSEDVGRTGVDGRFDLTSTFTWRRARGATRASHGVPPFQGARVLLIEKDGYGRLLFNTTVGRWFAQEASRHDFTADLGEIRLEPLQAEAR